MIDKENPNIEYRQASLSQIAEIILFVTLLILGFGILFFFLLFGIKEYGLIIRNIIALVGEVYIVISLIINILILNKIIKYKFDTHSNLYITLTFISLNIPCGIMMLYQRNK